MKRLLIWGAGDQGTVTLDCALSMKRYGTIDFLEIKEKGSRGIPGHLLYKEEEQTRNGILASYDEVIVATGSNDLRAVKISILSSLGIPLATIVHPTAVVSPSAVISPGCTILAHTVINTNVQIGIGCIINSGAIIEHDCKLASCVNICPGVSIAGHTTIGKNAYWGIGCTVINAIEIGEKAIVGAGAVVI